MYNAINISDFLNSTLYGENLIVNGVSSINDVKNNTIIFINKYKPEYLEQLNNDQKNFLVLCISEYKERLSKPHIIVNNPRLSFAKVVSHFFMDELNYGIKKTVIIGNNVTVGDNITIMNNTVIEHDVEIGDNVYIGYNVIIKKGTIIGKNSVVKSNSVIGEEGFGFEKDEHNVPIRIPHMGRVIIGENVEIGSLNSICRGTINDTIIKDNVKLSDQVHIAHNATIESKTMLATGVKINGSVTIGENVWVAPNSVIMNNIKIGDNVIIGLGSVVIKGVEKDKVVAGNPAKYIK